MKYGLTGGESFLRISYKQNDYKWELRFALFVLAFCAVATVFTYWPKPQPAHADTIPTTYQQRAPIMHATPAQIAVTTDAICKQTIADHKLINEPMSPAAKNLCSL